MDSTVISFAWAVGHNNELVIGRNQNIFQNGGLCRTTIGGSIGVRDWVSEAIVECSRSLPTHVVQKYQAISFTCLGIEEWDSVPVPGDSTRAACSGGGSRCLRRCNIRMNLVPARNSINIYTRSPRSSTSIASITSLTSRTWSWSSIWSRNSDCDGSSWGDCEDIILTLAQVAMGMAADVILMALGLCVGGVGSELLEDDRPTEMERELNLTISLDVYPR